MNLEPIESNLAKIDRNVTIEKARRKAFAFGGKRTLRYGMPDYFTTARNRILSTRYEQKVDALDLKGNWYDELVYEDGNMTVIIKVQPDDCPDFSFLGDLNDDEGDVINPEWFYSEYGRCHEWKWFKSENTSVAELTAHYNGHLGMSKHNARLAAIRSLQEDARTMRNNEQYGITVTVEIDGTEIGSDSLWGNDGLESEASVWEVVEYHGMIENAAAELDGKIANLTARLAKLTAIQSTIKN